MRLGAHSPPSRPATAELRPQLGLFVALASGLAVAVGLLLTQPITGTDAATECEAVAQAAIALGVAPVIPELAHGDAQVIDCRRELISAGVPIAPRAAPHEGRPMARVRVEFERPRLISPNRMIMNYGVICGGLCGEGYEVILVRRNGQWMVVSRSNTWIA